ncbi:hypothetical protein ACFX19_009676 [Malus domestica]
MFYLQEEASTSKAEIKLPTIFSKPSSLSLSLPLLCRFSKPLVPTLCYQIKYEDERHRHILCIPSFNSHMHEHGSSSILLRRTTRRPSPRPPQPHHPRCKKKHKLQNPSHCSMLFPIPHQPQGLPPTPKEQEKSNLLVT